MGKYYKWEQSGYTGIVEADSIAAARKDAEQSAPYNPFQSQVRVRPATKEDGDWFMGMGGGLGGKALDPAKFFKNNA